MQYRVELCDYGNVEKSILCDKIVSGMTDDTLRDKLLQTANLTLEQCLEMCRLSEHSSQQLASAVAAAQNSEVLAITQRDTYKTRLPYIPQRGRARGYNTRWRILYYINIIGQRLIKHSIRIM